MVWAETSYQSRRVTNVEVVEKSHATCVSEQAIVTYAMDQGSVIAVTVVQNVLRVTEAENVMIVTVIPFVQNV